MRGHVADAKFEMALLRFVRHPHIVNYVSAFVYEGPRGTRAGLYQEYCDQGGLSKLLEERLQADTLIPERAVRRIFWQMIDVLGYLAHGAPSVIRRGLQGCTQGWVPIMHRDIKPENILLKTDDSAVGFKVKLADFGVAGRADAQGDVAGTPEWLPPETPRQGVFTDVWMLGLVILACCNPRLLHLILANVKPRSGAGQGYSQGLLAVMNYALTPDWRTRPKPVELAAMCNRVMRS